MTVMPSEQTVVNSTASEHNEPEKAASENQAVAKVISTRHPLGWLDLPPEMRLMIFRHLLIAPDGGWTTGLKSPDHQSTYSGQVI